MSKKHRANQFSEKWTVNKLIKFCHENNLSLDTEIRIAGGIMTLEMVRIEDVDVYKRTILLYPND